MESSAYELGRILTEQFELPNLKDKGKKRSLTRYTYDNLGRPITITNPAAQSVGYQYNADGNRTRAAKILGVSKRTIQYRLQEWGVTKRGQRLDEE